MTLYVGIDVAKNKHDLAVLSGSGELVTKHFRFQNSYHGFHERLLHLKQLDEPTNLIRIALEDTGHYAYNLVHFLRNHDYLVFTYNPSLIKEFARSLSMRKAKTDKKDALTIARKLRNDTDAPCHIANEQMKELKALTRYQTRLIHDRSKYKTHYVRLLDIAFPELARIVTNLHNQSVYELLTHYPSPTKIAREHLKTLLKIKRLTAEKAIQIQEAARQTIGTSSASLELELAQTIDMIRFYNSQIDKVGEKINAFIAQIDSPNYHYHWHWQSSWCHYSHRNQGHSSLQESCAASSLAGLEPSVYQSGQMDVTGRMVKRESPYLRYALILAAQSAARYSPTFRAYLFLKLSQGKYCNVAISHVAKKLIRVIFYLLTNNLTFDEAKLV